MGRILVFSILSLEDFEILDIFGIWAILTNWGKQGQIGLFDIFALNYVRKTYLRHGCIDRIEK